MYPTPTGSSKFLNPLFDDIVCPMLSGGRYRNRHDKTELAMTFDLYSIQSC